MKVLFCAHRYYPEVGGIPTVTDLICRELLRMGWEVEVATITPSAGGEEFPYPILRAWSTGALRQRMREVDCVVMQHLSLRHLLPLWLSRARSLTVLHSGLEAWNKKLIVYTAIFRLHLWLSRHTAAVSDALRRHLLGVKITLRNPYDDSSFFMAPALPPPPREQLAFVGRVVSVKGLEFAVEALSLLCAQGRDCHLTIIGDGPHLPAMRSLVRQLNLEARVTFTGEKRPGEIPPLLRQLGTLLVPSNYFEAFGLIALEALACGMDVVAFRRGGLPEAVGEAGLICDENTSADLAAKVARLLDEPDLRARLHANRARHLEQFRKAVAAARYRDVLSAIVAGQPLRASTATCEQLR